MKQLKAYQTGDYDVVAHYSPEEAKQFLCDEFGYDIEDIDKVFELKGGVLNKPMIDEDGNEYHSICEEMKNTTDPKWITGWE
jgi:hypothetical protein